MKALGPNAVSYEAIALRLVSTLDETEVSAEVGTIALKMASLILDIRVRDAWNAFGKMEFSSTLGALESSEERSPDSEV
jgi:hypothetical protein